MIKRVFLLVVFLSIFVPMALAQPLEVEKVDRGSTTVLGLGNPAIYELIITNNDGEQSMEIYSFAGISFEPSRIQNLLPGENVVMFNIYPRTDLITNTGNYNFEYELKGSISGITKDNILVRMVKAEDTLEIIGGNFSIGDNQVKIKIVNLQKTNLDNVTIHFTSLFFDEQKKISIKPHSTTEINVELKKEGIEKITSGSYVFDSEIEYNGVKANFDSSVDYLPKEDSELSKEGSGLIVRKTTYNLTNTGNTVIDGKIETSRNVVSRLFTINSVKPSEVERNAFYAMYVWEKRLSPGESYAVNVTTNYTIPFIILILIVGVGLLVRIYTRTNIVAKKRVSYVKTKNGVFALKVTIHVRAKKFVENVQIIDRLPGMTKLYEKFGIMPDKIDAGTRRLFWNIERLNAGEERIYSYVIYSKVSVVGRFELPVATVTYQREGKSEQAFSNRTFFIADTMRTDLG